MFIYFCVLPTHFLLPSYSLRGVEVGWGWDRGGWGVVWRGWPGWLGRGEETGGGRRGEWREVGLVGREMDGGNGLIFK